MQWFFLFIFKWTGHYSVSAVVAVLLKITQLIESLIKKNAPCSLAAAHQTWGFAALIFLCVTQLWLKHFGWTLGNSVWHFLKNSWSLMAKHEVVLMSKWKRGTNRCLKRLFRPVFARMEHMISESWRRALLKLMRANELTFPSIRWLSLIGTKRRKLSLTQLTPSC